MTISTAFRVRALPATTLDTVRRTGRDSAGRPVEALPAGGGEPLRCCLRDAEAGESLLLFGYAPPVAAGPYREVGPVFAHAVACPGPTSAGGHPPAWRGRPQVLRAYDRQGRIHGGRVHDGTDPETVIGELFADPAVYQLHSRNVVYGCYMFAVERAARPGGQPSGGLIAPNGYAQDPAGRHDGPAARGGERRYQLSMS